MKSDSDEAEKKTKTTANKDSSNKSLDASDSPDMMEEEEGEGQITSMLNPAKPLAHNTLGPHFTIMERSSSDERIQSQYPQGDSNDEVNRQKSVTYVKASTGLFDFLIAP